MGAKIKGMPYIQKSELSKGTPPEHIQWICDVAKCVNWRIDQAWGWVGL